LSVSDRFDIKCVQERRPEIDNFSTYLTYSDEDLKWQLTCTNIGSNEVKPGTTYPPNLDKHPRAFKGVATARVLAEYQIIYITRGRGRFASQGQEYTIIPGTVMILFPGVKHAYRPDDDTGWDEYWVGFKGEYFESLQSEGVISPDKPVHYIGLHDVLVKLYTTIFERVEKQRPYYQYRISANIMMLLAEIISYDRRQEHGSQSDSLIEKVKFILQENLYGNIEMEDMAGKLNLSSSYLGEVFKSYTGLTPYQYYLHLKVNKAKELLEAGESSIKEIAHRLAFEDQYYFSRLFKKKTGVPPSQWTMFHYEGDTPPLLDPSSNNRKGHPGIGI
jgi:AraC-like DNA-binding protein